jgi:uncharacterized RDD family membrane protein YckC
MAATAPDRLIAAPPRVPYAGIGTRAIALAIDAAIVNGLLLLAAGLLALVSTLVGDLRPQWLVAALACAGWLIGVVSYFALFWATAGQTPGMRLMRLRVITASSGELPGLGRSLIRVVGLGLAIIPLFAGFLPVFVDDRRRALPDFMARTVVVHAPDGP